MSSTSDTTISENISVGLAERCNQWLALARSTNPVDRVAVETAVKALYLAVDGAEAKEPLIVFCESPWQSVAMVAALKTGLTRKQASKLTAPADGASSQDVHTKEISFHRWERVWDQIDRHGGEEFRQKFAEAASPAQKPAPSNWFNHMPFIKKTAEEARDALPSWLVFPKLTVTQGQAQLTRELHGVCGIRLSNEPKFPELKAQYESQFSNRLATDSLTMQLRMQLVTVGTGAMNVDFSGLLNVQNLVKLGFEAARGNIQEEFDKLYKPEDRTLFSFAMTSSTAATAGMSVMPGAVAWLPFYEYLCEELPWLPVGPTNKKRMRAFLDVARHVQHCILLDKICVISERPSVMKCDDNGRLHSESGPALLYADGFDIYSWHGTTVPKELIDNPSSLTAGRILTEPNAEVRRVMIELFGLSNFIVASGAKKIHEDECGVLYKKDLLNDEPLVMVKVINSTPEPDGTRRSYFLRVPPTITTAREAVAWTFDVKPQEYSPKRQT